jgi:hypothetical protein
MSRKYASWPGLGLGGLLEREQGRSPVGVQLAAEPFQAREVDPVEAPSPVHPPPDESRVPAGP